MAISLETVEKAIELAGKRPANLRYFFSRLSSDEWIDPLRELGVFKKPPHAIRENDTISFPEWPESQYLLRMADVAPEKVQRVLLEVPETDNISIHQDTVLAATKIPATLAVPLAERERKWISQQPQLWVLYPEKVADLIAHLAGKGQAKTALSLARALLAISAPVRKADSERVLPPEPRAKFDQWHFERVLARIVPDLVQAAPMESLNLLCDLLARAVQIHGSERRERPALKEDYSWIWRPQIANARLRDLKDVLVSALRDAAIRISELGNQELHEVISALTSHRWRIFTRIATYVIAQSPHADRDIARDLLRDETNYKSTEANPEFTMLLERKFAQADRETQAHVFEIINRGPDRETARRLSREFYGEEPSEEKLDLRADHWRRSWLTGIGTSLPTEWLKRYDALTSRLGEPSRAETEVGFVGESSPYTVEELKSLGLPEMIEKVKSFRPTGDWNTPTVEGLSRMLCAVVTCDPLTYSKGAKRFEGLDPTYVRGLFEGFRTATKTHLDLDWPSILRLCAWVLRQPRHIPGPRLPDSDPDWGWTRKSIAWLLSEAITESLPPLDSHDEVWNLLAGLAGDEDPNPQHETEYSSGGYSPSLLSLNTVRGVALEAVIRYALWLQEHRIDYMHRIAPVLEEHLDLTKDASFLVREVLGRWLPWLVKLNESWARQNLSRIFPPENAIQRLVAWQNYVLFSHAFDAVLPVISSEYRWAIDQSGSEATRANEDADRHLVEHLMTFFWRGKLDLAQGGLIEYFYLKSSDRLKEYALEFLGRSLEANPDENIPAMIRQRLKMLWQSRVEARNNKLASGAELAAFGWWFVSERFDPEWSCQQLLLALQLARRIDPDFKVVKGLAGHVDQRPLQTLEALFQIVEADREGWSFYGWEAEAKQILQRALQMNDSRVHEAAKRVIDLLFAKGHFGYRGLLQSPNRS